MTGDPKEANLAMNHRLGISVSRTLVMGILNITQDSFSDGGLWLHPQAAVKHAQDMIASGADVVDLGAESTRPGAVRVDEETEKTRIVQAVEGIRKREAHDDSSQPSARRVPLSLDTTRSSVAAAGLEAGADIINDVSGGQLDPTLPSVAADYGCPYIVQHWRGWLTGKESSLQGKSAKPPASADSVYPHGVLIDVYDELMHQVDAVLAAGVSPDQIILDPGLGFSKPRPDTNLPLIAHMDKFQKTGFPLLIGHSRKRFISRMIDPVGGVGGQAEFEARDALTAGLTALVAEREAWAVRVHEIPRNLQAAAAGSYLAEVIRSESGGNGLKQ